MKIVSLTAAALLLGAGSASAAPMAMDTPISMGPLEIVCTGVGSAKDDAQWLSYPVRIEFSNGAAQYLAGAHVRITQGGTTHADFECAGPWVLVKGPSASYKATVSLLWEGDKSDKSVTFNLGRGGQKRVVIQFGPTQPRSNSALTAPDGAAAMQSGAVPPPGSGQ